MMETKKNHLAHWFAKIITPLEVLLHHSMSAGVVLLLTTMVAVLITNSSYGEAFHHFWEMPLTLSVGQWQLSYSLHHWINDGLMVLFFLLVGLELKREFLVGELSSPRDALLPIIAAVGGMVVPALIYAFFNASLPSAHGWGIPMATDIAFAVGILALLGKRIPKGAVIFLLALAIVDDLGAVLVIAFFYTQAINMDALIMAGVMTLLLLFLNKSGVRHPVPYIVIGILLWYAMLQSGVHATIAGVILAFCVPARPALTTAEFHQQVDQLQRDFNAQNVSSQQQSAEQAGVLARSMESMATAVQSPLRRMEVALEPWVLFLIIPLFALANAGVDVKTLNWQQALHEPVVLGVTLGLVLGKFVGISLASFLAVKLGVATLRNEIQWSHILGVAWLGGIGFTMSLFVSQLAFTDSHMIEQAKLGILLASSVAALVGLVWLLMGTSRPDKGAS